MSYLPSSPTLVNIAGLLAKYPRRGILLFKLLEDIKGSFSPLTKGVRELIIAYTSDSQPIRTLLYAQQDAV